MIMAGRFIVPLLIVLIAPLHGSIVQSRIINGVEVWRADSQSATLAQAQLVTTLWESDNNMPNGWTDKSVTQGQLYSYWVRTVQYHRETYAGGGLGVISTVPAVTVQGATDIISVNLVNTSGTTKNLLSVYLYEDDAVSQDEIDYAGIPPLLQQSSYKQTFKVDLYGYDNVPGDNDVEIILKLDTPENIFKAEITSKLEVDKRSQYDSALTPTGLTATTQANGNVHLSWTPQGTGFSEFTGGVVGIAMTPPVITQELQTVAAVHGESVTLSFTASGSGLAWTWYRDDVFLRDGGTSYTINSVQEAHEGLYKVVVSNLAGEVATSAFLVVGSAYDNGDFGGSSLPEAPAALAITDLSHEGFTVNWAGVSEVDNYRVLIAMDPGFIQRIATFGFRDVGTTTTLQVSGLVDGRTYYVSVRTEHDGRNSVIAEPLTVTTLPPPPVALPVTVTFNDDFKAQWEPVDGATGYEIDVAIDPDFNTIIDRFDNVSVGNQAFYDVRSLDRSFTYYFRVRAITVSGTSLDSNTVSYRFDDNSTPATLTISDMDQSFGSNGGSHSLSVNSNAIWVWTKNASWITSTESSSQNGDQAFSYSVSPNTGASPRTASISFTADGVNRVHTVTQSGTSQAVEVEGSGGTSLLLGDAGYFVGDETRSLKYQGSQLGTIAGWELLGVEAVTGGYEVMLRQTGGGYLLWVLDGDGNIIGGEALSGWEYRNYESRFGQDFDGDGTQGYPPAQEVENAGDTSLLLGDTGYFIGSEARSLKYQGSQVNAVAGWTLLGAEAVDSGYEIIWRHDNGSYVLWELDGDGNFTGGRALAGYAYRDYESRFEQDFDGDGTQGYPPAQEVENAGGTSLLLGDTGYFLGDETLTLKYQGSQVGTIPGWTVLGVEAVSGGYEAILYHDGTGVHFLWEIDSSGNITGGKELAGYAYRDYESRFEQDFDGDGTQGYPPAQEVESAGDTRLLLGDSGYFLGDETKTLKYLGSQIGTISGWTVLGAEAVSGGYEVMLRNDASGQHFAWEVDSAGNIIGGLALAGTSYRGYESRFGQDFDNDGHYGEPPLEAIESSGSLSLLRDGSGYYINSRSQPVTAGGVHVGPGTYAGWSAIAADIQQGVYYVVWRNDSMYWGWQISPDGAYIAGSFLTAGQAAYYETGFSQDINENGSIENPSLPWADVYVGTYGGPATTGIFMALRDESNVVSVHARDDPDYSNYGSQLYVDPNTNTVALQIGTHVVTVTISDLAVSGTGSQVFTGQPLSIAGNRLFDGPAAQYAGVYEYTTFGNAYTYVVTHDGRVWFNHRYNGEYMDAGVGQIDQFGNITVYTYYGKAITAYVNGTGENSYITASIYSASYGGQHAKIINF